jgi:Carboxypeptidase regulatory-like domain/TonB-dependent Receptor Plug Domain
VFLPRLRFCALCVAFATIFSFGFVSNRASAQDGDSAVQLCQISGMVSDDDNRPAADADITVSGPVTETTTTRADGTFVISGLAAGTYTLLVRKADFADVSKSIVLVPGTSISVTASLVPNAVEKTTVIGRIGASSTRGTSTISTTAASVATIDRQRIDEQGFGTMAELLDEIPGVTAGAQNTSGNYASQGAFSYPMIRGAQTYETDMRFEGVPLRLFDESWLRPQLLDSISVIKGPAAQAPDANYDVGGTLDLTTRSATAKPSFTVLWGHDSFGGQSSDWAYTGATADGKFSWVVDYDIFGTPGPLSGPAGDFLLPIGSGTTITYPNGSTVTVPGSTTHSATPPGVNTSVPQTATLLGCCHDGSSSGNFNVKSLLIKVAYNFSPETSLGFTSLGGHTYSDEEATHAYTYTTQFTPAAGYAGSIPAGPVNLYDNVSTYYDEYFNNNDQIDHAYFTTKVGKATFRADYLANSYSNLRYEPPWPPATGESAYYNLYGSFTPTGATSPVIFNGQNVLLSASGGYYDQTTYLWQQDQIYSLNIPIWSGSLTAGWERTWKQSFSQRLSAATISSPYGTGDELTTYSLRGDFNLSPKLEFIGSLFQNDYRDHFTNDVGVNWLDSQQQHTDERVGFAYHPAGGTTVRLGAGSAIVPLDPQTGNYGASLDAKATPPEISSDNTVATSTDFNGSIQPETSFGYDLGIDHAFNDGVTKLTFDAYLTDLWNQWQTTDYFNGYVSLPSYVAGNKSGFPTGPNVTVPLYTTATINLSQARYEGIELAVARTPRTGLGYIVSGTLMRAYPYNIPQSAYTTPTSKGQPVNNLTLVPNINFQSGSYQPAVPYSTGYAQVNYRTRNNIFATLGTTYFGPNNSFDVPAFFLTSASLTVPLSKWLDLQFSSYNTFNTHSSDYVTEYNPATTIETEQVNGQATYSNRANTIGPGYVQVLLRLKL